MKYIIKRIKDRYILKKFEKRELIDMVIGLENINTNYRNQLEILTRALTIACVELCIEKHGPIANCLDDELDEAIANCIEKAVKEKENERI